MNPNTVWARTLMEEVAAAGVTDICMAPGSRSTPLVMAAARLDAVRLRVFIDERSAAFFALGLGRATHRPAAVLTTSGTAVANLLPAVVEASQAEVPLVVLSADRPRRLRDADANQTIAQAGIFGPFVRWQTELPEARADDGVLRHLRVQVCRAVAEARGLPAGPVHIDIPFEKPLEPDAAGSRGAPPSAPHTRIAERRPRLDEAGVERLTARLRGVARGVLLAGPHPEAPLVGPAVREFARRTGFLVLADPLSGARWPSPDPGVASCIAHDLWLHSDTLADALEPELVLRTGAAPTSAALLGWLSRHAEVPQIVVDAGHRYKDHLAVAHEVLPACPADALPRVVAALGEATGAEGEWARHWRRVDAAAHAVGVADGEARDAAGPRGKGGDAPGAPRHEGEIARAVVAALDEGTPLFVSSSMPIRDVDAFGGTRKAPLSVFGNRGASGIDGIASTALGVSAGRGTSVVALVGDLAFLHDVNGLLAAREPDAAVVFVVVNNDGGGIFHMLPIADHEPEFTPYFATPHGIDPGRAAALYGVPHHRVETLHALDHHVRSALSGDRSVVIEIRTDRATNREARLKARRVAIEAAEAEFARG